MTDRLFFLAIGIALWPAFHWLSERLFPYTLHLSFIEGRWLWRIERKDGR